MSSDTRVPNFPRILCHFITFSTCKPLKAVAKKSSPFIIAVLKYMWAFICFHCIVCSTKTSSYQRKATFPYMSSWFSHQFSRYCSYLCWKSCIHYLLYSGPATHQPFHIAFSEPTVPNCFKFMANMKGFSCGALFDLFKCERCLVRSHWNSAGDSSHCRSARYTTRATLQCKPNTLTISQWRDHT